MDFLMIAVLAVSFVLLKFLVSWCDKQVEKE